MIKMSFEVIEDGAAFIKKKRGLTITSSRCSRMASWATVSGSPRRIKKAIKDITDNSGWHIHNLSFAD